jgi:hypothetical protein
MHFLVHFSIGFFFYCRRGYGCPQADNIPSSRCYSFPSTSRRLKSSTITNISIARCKITCLLLIRTSIPFPIQTSMIDCVYSLILIYTICLYLSRQLGFSLIIPGFTTTSFNANQQQALCSALTSNWNSSSSGRDSTCSIGSISAFNGTSTVLVSGYAFFTFTGTPSVTDIQTAQALRDARVIALTTNVTSILGAAFPTAIPNCACDGVSVVTVYNTSPFVYNTNITGVPGPMQCGARLIYDNPNALINQVGLDDGSVTPSNLGKYCSTPFVTGGVVGVPGSGSCRQYGIIASADGTTQAAATAVIANGGVSGTTALTGGSGYTSAPTVTVSAPSPLAAQVTYTLNTASQPTSFVLASASNGPYSAPPQVTFLSNTCVDTANTGSNPASTCRGGQATYQINGTPRTGAVCLASDIANAAIDASGSVTSSGLNFPTNGIIYCTSSPTITLSTNTLQVPVTAQITATITSGSVSNLNVVSSGSGYRSIPTITISAPSSDSIGKLCGPNPITALPASIGYPASRSITTNGQCQPLGRDTYASKVCSIPAAPGGQYAPLNAFTCNVIGSFINQPGSTVTSPCGVLAQTFITTISPSPSQSPPPPPSPKLSPPPPVPVPAPSPPPASPSPPASCRYAGTYNIESVACAGRYIAFSTDNCNNSTLLLRTSSQSSGNRRIWRLNASATAGSVPAATGMVAQGRLKNCPTTNYINLAAANSSPTPRLAGSSWMNRIIPVDATRGCNTVWIQAAGNNPYQGKYLGYGSCSSQTAFKWFSASGSSGIQWRLNKV